MSLGEKLKSARESLFRFEYLQEFDVPEESPAFRKYQTNEEVEIRHLMQGWWDFLEAEHAEGVRTERVRLVRAPQTRYLEWELLIHRESLKHGDHIRILKEDSLTPDVEVLGDFWLIDDTTALKMNYGARGRFLGFEEVDAEPYIQAKIYLLKNSAPLT